MIVGVLSDTHLTDNESSCRFLKQLREIFFSEAEAIVHAGDMIDPAILEIFLPLPVYAVRGNMDSATPHMPFKRIVELAGFHIGLIHGWGPPRDLEQRVLQEFSGRHLDCLVYGHSHYPANHKINGTLFFNPGSPTDPRQAPFPTVGLLHLDHTIRGEILRCG